MTSLIATLKVQGKPTKRVAFKGDNPNLLMKPPCTITFFDRDAPVSKLLKVVVAPLEEDLNSLHRSKKAWRPKRRQQPLKRMPVVVPTDGELLKRKHTNQENRKKIADTQCDVLDILFPDIKRSKNQLLYKSIRRDLGGASSHY